MIELDRPECPNPGALERGDYKHPANKDALRQGTHDKCMYCESKVTHIDFGDVEHIKPKANPRFRHLEFEWSNLGYACARCNTAKGDYWSDDSPLLDPYSEDPAEHLFALGWMLLQRNGSERGEATIRVITLNRQHLLEERRRRLMDIHRAMNAAFRTVNEELKAAALEELRREADVDKEHSLFVRALLDANDV